MEITFSPHAYKQYKKLPLSMQTIIKSHIINLKKIHI